MDHMFFLRLTKDMLTVMRTNVAGGSGSGCSSIGAVAAISTTTTAAAPFPVSCSRSLGLLKGDAAAEHVLLV